VAILFVSLTSAANISTASIEGYPTAMWMFVAIVLTFAGLLVSPILVFMTFGQLVRESLNPISKIKRKNHE
jgi:hypothetical protein